MSRFCRSSRRCSVTARCAMRSPAPPTRRRSTRSSRHGSRMLQVTVAQLHEDNREALALAWVAGREGRTEVRRESAAAAALIGHLNLTHPNSVQVIGAYEAGNVTGLAERLFAASPAAVICADGL